MIVSELVLIGGVEEGVEALRAGVYLLLFVVDVVRIQQGFCLGWLPR